MRHWYRCFLLEDRGYTLAPLVLVMSSSDCIPLIFFFDKQKFVKFGFIELMSSMLEESLGV